MSDSNEDRDPVELLAEDFTQRQLRGEHPTIDEYVEAHPELAQRIRRLFPILVVMHEVTDESEGISSDKGVSQTASLTQQNDQDTFTSPTKSKSVGGMFFREPEEEDYRKLVRRQMLIIWCLAIFTYSAIGVIIAADLNPFLDLSNINWQGWVLCSATMAYLGYAVFASFRNPEMSLVGLRRLEWPIQFLTIVSTAYLQWAVLVDNLDFEGPQHALAFVTAWNFSHSFIWFSAIVTYGLLVPNPWWRTAFIVGFASLVAVLVIPLAAPFGEAIRENIPYLLSWTLASLAMGSALAIFGSFKIGRLQQEVFVARKLGPYQLKEKLGTGGMGEVYLAEHRLLKRPCAVKLIRPDRSGEQQLVSRFEREVQVTSQLTHPNTVDIFDYGSTEDGVFYYVMEYLEGLNLDELVDKHGPLPPGRVIHFVRQLCGALHEAHSQGLVHRDIKPSNVIICKQGGVHDVVKLLDFGLVGTLRSDPDATKLTGEGITIGTPQFMSPEQARGDDVIDARSDIYSLGGVMYFLLAGRPPFEDSSPLRVVLAHLEAPVPSLRKNCPEVPEDLEQVVMRCLEKEPENRFPDIPSVNQVLNNLPSITTWNESDAAKWWRQWGPSKQSASV